MYVLALVVLPPLFVFGIYHLSLWLNVAGIRSRVFWRRVALASAISHGVLALGFFLFSWLDYRMSGDIAGVNQSFESFLFNTSPFWSLMSVFDTIAMVVLLGVFGTLDNLGVGFGPVVGLTAAVVFLVGTLQWYWVGGSIGAAFERLWSGLKGPDDDPGGGRPWL